MLRDYWIPTDDNEGLIVVEQLLEIQGGMIPAVMDSAGYTLWGYGPIAWRPEWRSSGSWCVHGAQLQWKISSCASS